MLLRQRRRSAGYTLAAAAAAAVEATTDAKRAMSSKNIDVCQRRWSVEEPAIAKSGQSSGFIESVTIIGIDMVVDVTGLELQRFSPR
jgi:hypothetical protein